MVFIFSIVFLFFSCGKEEAKLIIYEDSTASVEQSDSPEPEMDQGKPLIVITRDDVLNIVVRQDGAPGMYLGDDGELYGFYVDLERMVMNEMGQRYEFIPYSDMGPIVQGIKSGIYHDALSVPDLPDYRSLVNLSLPFEILHYITFVQMNNTDITGNTRDELLLSLHGKKVGVQTQGHIYQSLRDIREIELVEYPTTTQAMADLDKGLLDAVPDVERIGIYYAAQNNWNIKAVGEPIISQKISTGFSQMLDLSLLERYNYALATILKDGRYEALYTSYFGELKERDRP